MAFTSEQLASLEAAAASGQLRIQLGDKVIQYQTTSDLINAIRIARIDVLNANSTTTPARPYYEFERG